MRAEWFNRFCASLPVADRYVDSGRYRRPCAGPVELRTEYLDAQDAARLADRPTLVTWPPAGADDVPPAFFIEEPDPLPDREVAGYPLSVQFNPGSVQRVEIRGFSLYREPAVGRDPIAPTRLLDRHSDPHEVLTAFEFALFPLDRLDWATRYRAVVDVVLDGHPQRIE